MGAVPERGVLAWGCRLLGLELEMQGPTQGCVGSRFRPSRVTIFGAPVCLMRYPPFFVQVGLKPKTNTLSRFEACWFMGPLPGGQKQGTASAHIMAQYLNGGDGLLQSPGRSWAAFLNNTRPHLGLNRPAGDLVRGGYTTAQDSLPGGRRDKKAWWWCPQRRRRATPPAELGVGCGPGATPRLFRA